MGGQRLEIVASYQGTELEEGVFVTVIDAVDAADQSSMITQTPAVNPRKLRDTPRPLVGASSPPSSPFREPWLRNFNSDVDATPSIWSSDGAPPQSYILGSVSIPGLRCTEESPSLQRLRSVFLDEFKSSLAVQRSVAEVQISRVAALDSASIIQAHDTSGGRRMSAAVRRSLSTSTTALTIEFRIVPNSDRSNLLDSIESRLILLSKGGIVAKKFDHSLAAHFREDNLCGLRNSTRTHFQEPQNLQPRQIRLSTNAMPLFPKSSKLANGKLDPPRKLSAKDDDEVTAENATLDAMVLAGLSIAAVAACTLMLVRRRRMDLLKPLRTEESSATATNSLADVSVHVDSSARM